MDLRGYVNIIASALVVGLITFAVSWCPVPLKFFITVAGSACAEPALPLKVAANAGVAAAIAAVVQHLRKPPPR